MTFSITHQTEGEWSLVKNDTLSSDFTSSLVCHAQLEALGRNYSFSRPLAALKIVINCFANCLFANISYWVVDEVRVTGGSPQRWLGYRPC